MNLGLGISYPLAVAQVRIYTTPWCGYCTQARELLASKGVQFEEIEVGDDDRQRVALIARTGRSTFPQIFIDDRFVGGSDELASLDRSGRLDALLF